MPGDKKMRSGEEPVHQDDDRLLRVVRGLRAAVVLVPVLCFLLMVMLVYEVRQRAVLDNKVVDLREHAYDLGARLEVVEAALSRYVLAGDERLRIRRSVVSAPLKMSPGGIPMVDQPYGHQPQRHRARHRLLSTYDDFDSDSDGKTEDPSIQPHHRSSAAFSMGTLGRVNTEEADDAATSPASPAAGTPSSQGADALREARRPPTRTAARRPADVMAHRRSRVPSTKRRKGQQRSRAHKRPGRKHHRHKGRRRKQLEVRGPAPGYADPPQFLRQRDRDREQDQRERSRHRSGSSGGHSRGKRLMRLAEQLREELGSTAAHFEGHTSNYSRIDPHYGGNGLLRNVQPDAVFADWREASWMRRHGFSRDFTLFGGQVTVKRPGVYHIYAQINYLDDSDINGFEILVNARSLTKCLTMEASDQRQKANTCYTAAAAFLDTGDSVTIRDLESHRISMFLPDRSFFGLMKLAGTGSPERGRSDPQY